MSPGCAPSLSIWVMSRPVSDSTSASLSRAQTSGMSPASLTEVPAVPLSESGGCGPGDGREDRRAGGTTLRGGVLRRGEQPAAAEGEDARRRPWRRGSVGRGGSWSGAPWLGPLRRRLPPSMGDRPHPSGPRVVTVTRFREPPGGRAHERAGGHALRRGRGRVKPNDRTAVHRKLMVISQLRNRSSPVHIQYRRVDLYSSFVSRSLPNRQQFGPMFRPEAISRRARRYIGAGNTFRHSQFGRGGRTDPYGNVP